MKKESRNLVASAGHLCIFAGKKCPKMCLKINWSVKRRDRKTSSGKPPIFPEEKRTRGSVNRLENLKELSGILGFFYCGTHNPGVLNPSSTAWNTESKKSRLTHFFREKPWGRGWNPESKTQLD